MDLNKKVKKSVLAKILMFVLCAIIILPMNAIADSISEAEARQEDIADEMAKLEDEIEALEQDENAKVEYQEALAKKIILVQEEIDKNIKKINDLNDEISVLEKKLEESQESMQDTIDLFQRRVKTLYVSGSTTELGTLEILLNASSLDDLSLKSEALKVMTEHDKQMMTKLATYMEETEEERAELNAKKEELAEEKKGLENNQSELEDLNAENNAALQSIRESKGLKEEAIEDLEIESEELQAYIREEIRKEEERIKAEREAAEQAAREQEQNNSNNGGSGNSGVNNGSSTPDPSYDGSFNPCWPIPGVTYISQHYGNNGHNGIDIAGAYGTPIVACEAGRVIIANDYDSWGDSWGFYVLIYHNDTYTTRYAHLSSLAVGQGQYVSKGTVIGYEGSTGNSTGPHLHFEVYMNGYRTNPWPYIGW